MLFDPNFALPHICSLLIATGFVFAARSRPLLARKLYTGLFCYAALVNTFVGWAYPESYLANARFVLLTSYRELIEGWFAQHITLAVSSIALGQAAVAFGLWRGQRLAQVALVGAIVFFLAIAPLGVGSAFPSSLIWAWGAGYLLTKERAVDLQARLWRRSRTGATRPHLERHA